MNQAVEAVNHQSGDMNCPPRIEGVPHIARQRDCVRASRKGVDGESRHDSHPLAHARVATTSRYSLGTTSPAPSPTSNRCRSAIKSLGSASWRSASRAPKVLCTGP